MPDRTDQFVRLLTLNERRVYAFILSLVGNWADADDVQQETNVRLWQEFDRYQPSTDFGAWACAVARFQVLSYRKKKGRSRVHFTDAFIDVMATEVSAQEDSATRHHALEGCIDRLPADKRELLHAYYAPNAVGSEVAARFGRTSEVLYKLISRIRRALHECVERQLKAQVRP